MVKSFQKAFKKELFLIEKHLHQSMDSLLSRKLKSKLDLKWTWNQDPYLSSFHFRKDIPFGIQRLSQSMSYSLFSGGKRFRSLLSLLTARCLKKDLKRVLPFSSALEMVHTYSLIHDDLPCMDDSSFRRGKKANHKVFGEALSVLSGNTLLTEAFSLLARSYLKPPGLGLRLIEGLSKAIGAFGMMGGQAIDMEMQKENRRKKKKNLSLKHLNDLHLRKTGALIEYSLFGAALILKAKLSLQRKLKKYGLYLGLAFQIADDLIDCLNCQKDQKDQKKEREDKQRGKKREGEDLHTFPGVIGLKEARAFLERLTKEALSCISEKEFKPLREIAEYNRNRQL